MLYRDLNQEANTGIPFVEDMNSIFQSITNILSTECVSSTAMGERLFLADFGSKLGDILFEPGDETTALRAMRYIYEPITRWEPRIIIDYAKTFIRYDDIDSNVAYLEIAGKVKGTNQPFVYRGSFLNE